MPAKKIPVIKNALVFSVRRNLDRRQLQRLAKLRAIQWFFILIKPRGILERQQIAFQSLAETPLIGGFQEANGLDLRLYQFSKLAAPLADMGHEVRVRDLTSGLHGVRIMPGGVLDGGADPRREGVVIAVD